MKTQSTETSPLGSANATVPMLEPTVGLESTPANVQFAMQDLDILAGTQFRRGPVVPRKRWQVTMWSFLASIIDALFLFGVVALAVASAQLALGGALSLSPKFWSFKFLTFGLMGLIFCYLVLLRSFLGFTLGEWACSLRLGFPWERLDSKYIPKIALRSFIVLSTGIVVLPILSLIFDSDFAGEASGVHLMSLK